jgi:biotin transport system substrate-specific component
MSKPATQAIHGTSGERSLAFLRQAALIIGASFLVALCARVTIPVPFTPVPLTLQNFGVLLVGLTLGSRRGFAALALYLVEGASGLPVFNPAGPGGLLQLLGPTGGYLLAYPAVAALAGLIAERGKKSFARLAAASFLGEIVLFAGGLAWLFVLTHSFKLAVQYGLYWFFFAEIVKVMAAAAIANRISRTRVQS